MKIAILGSTPLALEAAIRFHVHGASLTWFVGQQDDSLFTSSLRLTSDYVSDLGIRILGELKRSYDPEHFSWNYWVSDYLTPILEYLKEHQEIKSDQVVSVTKRFLAPGEVPKGKSRFLDLFRIIFQVNPQEFIEGQKLTNPETYDRLSKEFFTSLTSSIEMYQDYDLVLDLRDDLSWASASVSGRALGELRASDKICYGKNALRFSTQVSATPQIREMALIGSGSLAAEILVSIESWIKEPHSRLFIISHEENPFMKYLEVSEPQTKKKLQELFQFLDEEFQKEVLDFNLKLRKWQQLDDFIQVKVPKPLEPIPRLVYFSGHNVSAVDELLDRKRMFVTIEKPEFREGLKHPENNHLDLKTIGVDFVLVSHAKRDDSIIQVASTEVGLFIQSPVHPNIVGSWERDLIKLEGIENEIFKLFSPASSY